MRVGWRNEKPNCPFKITKLPFFGRHHSSLQKATLHGRKQLNAASPEKWPECRPFISLHLFPEKKGKSSKNRLKWSYGLPTVAHPLSVHHVGWWFFSVWSKVYFEWAVVTQNDTVETVWCREYGSCVSQRSCHTGASVRGVCNDMLL